MQKQISAGIIISCHSDFEDDPVSGECANLVPEQIGIICEGADSGTETIEMCREPIMQIVTEDSGKRYKEKDIFCGRKVNISLRFLIFACLRFF